MPMKHFILVILLVVIILPATFSAQTIDLRVKGVEVGTFYPTAIQKLGKPLSNKKGGGFLF